MQEPIRLNYGVEITRITDPIHELIIRVYDDEEDMKFYAHAFTGYDLRDNLELYLKQLREVEGLEDSTLHDYSLKIGRFISFCIGGQIPRKRMLR